MLPREAAYFVTIYIHPVYSYKSASNHGWAFDLLNLRGRKCIVTSCLTHLSHDLDNLSKYIEKLVNENIEHIFMTLGKSLAKYSHTVDKYHVAHEDVHLFPSASPLTI